MRAAQVTAGEAQIARFLAPEDCATDAGLPEAPSVETIFLRLDTMHPVMSDIRVREAIGLASTRSAWSSRSSAAARWPPQLVGPLPSATTRI